MCKREIGKDLGNWFNSVNIYWTLISAVYIQGDTTVNVTGFFLVKPTDFWRFLPPYKGCTLENNREGASRQQWCNKILFLWRTRNQNHIYNRLRTKLIFNSLVACVRKPLSNRINNKKVRRVWSTIIFKSKNSFIQQIFIDYLLCDKQCSVSFTRGYSSSNRVSL